MQTHRFNYPFLGALPPPLGFFGGALLLPPAFGFFGWLISGFPGLTFSESPPPSFSAVCFSVSGFVWLGLNAVLECAAASSDPDLLYSVDRGLSESLSWASFWASRVDVVLRKRGEKGGRVRRRTRVGWNRYMVFLGVYLVVVY